MIIAPKRFLHYFDWSITLLVALLAGIGLLFVCSSTYTTSQPFSIFCKKQFFGMLSGFAIYLFFTLVDYRTTLRWGYIGYIGVLVLLIFTLFKGSIGMGGQRWIDLFFFKIQPSELAKFCFPAFTVYLLQHNADTQEQKAGFIPIVIILLVSFVLIAKQPDLGTGLIVLFSGLLLCWFAQIPRKFFIYGFFFVAMATPLFWQLLKDYQKRRVLVFLGYGDSKKERYQKEQALIAVGSGGILGKGFLQGTQNKLQFLPEGRTDCIFAVICEEWGFVGAMIVLLLYGLLFARCLAIIKRIPQYNVQLCALGSIIHLMISTVINIMMVLGMLPIVGIPLPLLSYGISNLWITFASLGFFQNSTMQR